MQATAPWGWSQVQLVVSWRLGYRIITGCTATPGMKPPALKVRMALPLVVAPSGKMTSCDQALEFLKQTRTEDLYLYLSSSTHLTRRVISSTVLCLLSGLSLLTKTAWRKVMHRPSRGRDLFSVLLMK